jgi:hypothetical protein
MDQEKALLLDFLESERGHVLGTPPGPTRTPPPEGRVMKPRVHYALTW